jgi:hypothetical protein
MKQAETSLGGATPSKARTLSTFQGERRENKSDFNVNIDLNQEDAFLFEQEHTKNWEVRIIPRGIGHKPKVKIHPVLGWVIHNDFRVPHCPNADVDYGQSYLIHRPTSAILPVKIKQSLINEIEDKYNAK